MHIRRSGPWPEWTVPWPKDIGGFFVCFICEEDIENLDHFLLDCPQFKKKFDSIWSSLELKIIRSNPKDGIQIGNFIKKLNRQHTVMLLLGEMRGKSFKIA